MLVPGGPRLLKGAILSVPQDASPGAIIPFQYNPETMTRSLTARYVGAADADRANLARFEGAPRETIQADVVLDATDDLERLSPTALLTGISPQLAALERLLYPSTTDVALSEAKLLLQGASEIVPPLAPLSLFVWGALRVVPVRLDSMNVAEEAYDGLLNPIRATVSLTMQVLSYSDLPPGSLGHQIFLTYHTKLEGLALLQAASAAVKAAPLPVKLSI